MLARKVSLSKWRSKPYLPSDAVRADAVTGCLRTHDDALSVWSCAADDERELNQVFLALATGSKVSHFESMDIVILTESELDHAGLEKLTSEGDTAVGDLKSRHVDLIHLDLDKLSTLARIVAAGVHRSHVRRTARQIRGLVEQAVAAGRVRPEELSAELRRKLMGNATSG